MTLKRDNSQELSEMFHVTRWHDYQRISFLPMTNVTFLKSLYREWPIPFQPKINTLLKSNLKSERPEGPTIERWREGDDHVEDRHGRQEEDEQQHAEVEVVGSGSFKDSGLGNIAAHHSPALEIHGCVEPEDVDTWKARGKEGAHPRKESEHCSIPSPMPSCPRPAHFTLLL